MTMHAEIAAVPPSLRSSRAAPPAPVHVYEDPLDEDRADDQFVPATRRGLVRLALIAAETGGRFQREGIGVDPMAWMLAPRRLFDGQAALEACLRRDACVRALLLHGLGMDLDAGPSELDALAADDDDDLDDADGPAASCSAVESANDGGEGAPDRGRTALYTSTAVAETSGGVVHVFDAFLADSMSEARSTLRLRHGADLAAGADLLEGFCPHQPLAQALVSPALADMLLQVERDPSSPLARGLRVSIEQRFAA